MRRLECIGSNFAKVLLCGILAGLLACSQQDASSPVPPLSSESTPTTSQSTSQASTRSVQLDTPNLLDMEECTRGEAEPLLKPVPGQPAPTYQKIGKYEAIETIIIHSQTKLNIRQYGCSHYALEFWFFSEEETPPSIPDWLKQSAEILTKLPIGKSHASLLTMLADLLKQQAGTSFESGMPLSMSESETVTITTESHPERLVVLYEVAL